jgi:hypothetical protein
MFNQKLQQNGYTADWPAESSGPAHALRWTVKCLGELTLTFWFSVFEGNAELRPFLISEWRGEGTGLGAESESR